MDWLVTYSPYNRLAVNAARTASSGVSQSSTTQGSEKQLRLRVNVPSSGEGAWALDRSGNPEDGGVCCTTELKLRRWVASTEYIVARSTLIIIALTLSVLIGASIPCVGSSDHAPSSQSCCRASQS